MAHIAVNADVYAEPRQNIFFPGVIPSLDGQCVSQAKWFMQDMSDVPNPQTARGDARYVGQTLVRQGHAIEVPYSERKRGDLICYEFGKYGHIATQLSGGRVFEQNVAWPGVKSKYVDGMEVYASRIGSENEAWRKDKNPHVYRLKTYREGNVMELFNEGDRVNVNNSLYHEDRGYFKKYVDGQTTYKHAMEQIFGNGDFVREQFFNEGDKVNMANNTGWPQEPALVGWVWKRVATDYMVPKIQLEHEAAHGEYEQIGTIDGEPVYGKKS